MSGFGLGLQFVVASNMEPVVPHRLPSAAPTCSTGLPQRARPAAIPMERHSADRLLAASPAGHQLFPGFSGERGGAGFGSEQRLLGQKQNPLLSERVLPAGWSGRSQLFFFGVLLPRRKALGERLSARLDEPETDRLSSESDHFRRGPRCTRVAGVRSFEEPGLSKPGTRGALIQLHRGIPPGARRSLAEFRLPGRRDMSLSAGVQLPRILASSEQLHTGRPDWMGLPCCI